jgi:GNAT superfamily N-acetyltransferase
MDKVIIANKHEHSPHIRELFWEYLQWANARVNENFNVNFDITAMLEADMQDLDKFMPPKGRLLLGYKDDVPTGIACLKQLTPDAAEIKRMYVCSNDRGRGIGRVLIQRLLEEAGSIGYERVRLDSARFMTEAHQLYRSTGFRETEAYVGSEIPEAFQQHWIFMELELPIVRDDSVTQSPNR